jgi:hypothetical protein
MQARTRAHRLHRHAYCPARHVRRSNPSPGIWQVLWTLALVFGAAALVVAATSASNITFHDDDPLIREPETQDASPVREWTIDLFVDLTLNMFAEPGEPAAGARAGNVNTVDEVPDSSWFTNRILARPISIADAVRGPRLGDGPASGPWTIVGAKETGAAPGFTIQDRAGETWFVTFDASGHPEAATGALMVANRIFWTLGYWQGEHVLTRIRPEHVIIAESATVRPMSGVRRPMRQSDLDAIWERAHRSADGSFRAAAARKLPGQPLGGFRYYGTRPDDPNDVVPHEHRRELRALKVFGAWTNLVDIKAGNTLDVLVTEDGRGVVRHYLQDVGSTFGTGALAPREFDEGWEHLYQGDLVWKRLASFGFFIRPWQTLDYDESPAVGRFEGDEFNPLTWKPRVPVAALRHARADDLFWAARRVMAFSDDMIRAIVKTAAYTDPDDERHLAHVLIQRRNKIATAYLGAVNPLVDFALSPEGQLSFDNAAVAAGVAGSPAGGYRVSWARFDNSTGATAPLGEATIAAGERSRAPAPLPGEANAFVRIAITTVAPAQKTWAPVHVYFRRTSAGWIAVGIDRQRS